MLDDNGSRRQTLDFNQPLIKDMLALHLDFLRDQTDSWRAPAFRNDTRGYGNLVSKPLESLKITRYERAQIHEEPVRNTLVQDQVTPWIAAGQPAYDNGLGPCIAGCRHRHAVCRPRCDFSFYAFDYNGGITPIFQGQNTAVIRGYDSITPAPNNFERSITDDALYPAISPAQATRTGPNCIHGFAAASRSSIRSRLGPLRGGRQLVHHCERQHPRHSSDLLSRSVAPDIQSALRSAAGLANRPTVRRRCKWQAGSHHRVGSVRRAECHRDRSLQDQLEGVRDTEFFPRMGKSPPFSAAAAITSGFLAALPARARSTILSKTVSRGTKSTTRRRSQHSRASWCIR